MTFDVDLESELDELSELFDALSEDFEFAEVELLEPSEDDPLSDLLAPLELSALVELFEPADDPTRLSFL